MSDSPHIQSEEDFEALGAIEAFLDKLFGFL